MGELFGDLVPYHWQAQIFQAISDNTQHRFYLLTKQPQNLIKFSPFPDNCWVGVTVTTKEDFWRAFQGLGQIEARVKYLSFEPLLGSIWDGADVTLIVDWLIIGAQTKPYKPPKIEWVEGIVKAADRAGIPVFLKNNLEPLLESDHRAFMNPLYWRDGYYTSPEHPDIDLWLRQEMPEGL